MAECYEMVADENELKWFFDHVLFKPLITEAYSMVFVSRHKKLSEEEKKIIGLSSEESEFLSVQTVRSPKVSLEGTQKPWTFENFLRHVYRFNVDKRAYTTSIGSPLPSKSLSIIFYVNPCNNLKVWEEVDQKVNMARNTVLTAVFNQRDPNSMLPQFQCFGNVEDHIKHARAKCKGSVYWMDFDIDVPAWFKPMDKAEESVRFMNFADEHPSMTCGDIVKEWSKFIEKRNKYYNSLLEKLNNRFGKGKYVIVDTSGGYHVLVRTYSIRSNPHDFCKEVEEIYKQGVAEGNPEHINDKGKCAFEAIINDSQIPGLPLPGTYQYGRPVTVINKGDFE